MEALPNDLSERHGPITGMFAQPAGEEEWARYLLSDEQCDLLREELAEFQRPGYRQSPLWYEYHANESTDPGTVLFHGRERLPAVPCPTATPGRSCRGPTWRAT